MPRLAIGDSLATTDSPLTLSEEEDNEGEDDEIEEEGEEEAEEKGEAELTELLHRLPLSLEPLPD